MLCSASPKKVDFTLSLKIVKAPDLDPIDLDEIGSYWGVQDDQLSCRMLRVMLLGAVARIFEPGSKFDTMVVLKSDQGEGKSTSLRKLFGPKWLVDTQQPKHKDPRSAQVLVLRAKAELDLHDSRKESGLIKGLLINYYGHLPSPYGRFIEAHPRRSIMVGTCNRDDFLRDGGLGASSLSRPAKSIVRIEAPRPHLEKRCPGLSGGRASVPDSLPATSETRASNWRTRSRQPSVVGSGNITIPGISSPSMSAWRASKLLQAPDQPLRQRSVEGTRLQAAQTGEGQMDRHYRSRLISLTDLQGDVRRLNQHHSPGDLYHASPFSSVGVKDVRNIVASTAPARMCCPPRQRPNKDIRDLGFATLTQPFPSPRQSMKLNSF